MQLPCTYQHVCACAGSYMVTLIFENVNVVSSVMLCGRIHAHIPHEIKISMIGIVHVRNI